MAKPALSPSGRKVLNKALRAIQAMPDTLNMEDWLYHNPRARPTKEHPVPYCGTVACLAGHIVLAAGGEADSFRVAERALDALGVVFRYDISHALFFVNGWPEKFWWIYLRARSHRERAHIVIARVHHWLRTGE